MKHYCRKHPDRLAVLRILLRYLAHDVFRQGRRTVFILLILILVSASMLASLSLADTMVRTGTRIWRAEYGDGDIVISAGRDSERRLFRATVVDQDDPACELVVSRISVQARLKQAERSLPVTLIGTDLDRLAVLVELHFQAEELVYPFAGNKAIISYKTAAELGLQVGDMLLVVINDNRHALIIAAIAYAEGPFAFEAKPVLLMPLEKLQSAIGAAGRVESITIRLSDPAARGQVMRQLSGDNPGLSVAESYNEDHIRLQANRTQVPFLFIAIILCLMAAIVLAILFSDMVLDRLPLMGIFRAIGAGQRETHGVVLAESVVFGLLGGLAGWSAGLALLRWIIQQLSQGTPSRHLGLSVGWPQLAIALITSVGTSLLSAAICLKAGRTQSISCQIRGLNVWREQIRPHWSGLLLVVLPLAVLGFWHHEGGLVLYLACVIVLLTGLVLLMPACNSWILKLILRLNKNISGQPAIALYNSRHSRNFVILVTILSLIVTTVIIVHSITTSDQQGQKNLAQRTHYAIELFMPGLNRSSISRISQIKGVEAVSPAYYAGTVEVVGQTIALYRIQGISAGFDPIFKDLQISPDSSVKLAELAQDRNMLLTTTMQQLYKVTAGDVIVLKIYARDRTYREVPYTIIGFFDDYQTKLGRYGLIAESNFKTDFAAFDYDSLLVRTDTPDLTAEALLAAMGQKPIDLQLQSDLQNEIARESRQVLAAMQLISALAVLIGLLGLANTAMLIFHRRRLEVSLYYALGMTPGMILRLFLSELMLAGFAGVLNGLLAGLLIIRFALPRLIFALQIAMRIYIDIRSLWLGPVIGLGIAATASLLCLLFLRRENPMSGLREE
jgi:putative ABC transport system permease protein